MSDRELRERLRAVMCDLRLLSEAGTSAWPHDRPRLSRVRPGSAAPVSDGSLHEHFARRLREEWSAAEGGRDLRARLEAFLDDAERERDRQRLRPPSPFDGSKEARDTYILDALEGMSASKAGQHIGLSHVTIGNIRAAAGRDRKTGRPLAA